MVYLIEWPMYIWKNAHSVIVGRNILEISHSLTCLLVLFSFSMVLLILSSCFPISYWQNMLKSLCLWNGAVSYNFTLYICRSVFRQNLEKSTLLSKKFSRAFSLCSPLLSSTLSGKKKKNCLVALGSSSFLNSVRLLDSILLSFLLCGLQIVSKH